MNIKLIKEENNNYGHNNLIFKGDINFPNLKDKMTVYNSDKTDNLLPKPLFTEVSN